MGSGISGLYHGTHGSGGGVTSSKGSKSSMHRSATNWAHREEARLLQQSKNKRNQFNTACAVHDSATGKMYYGKNRGIELNGTDKNPILFGDGTHKGILPTRSYYNYDVGNCAEVDAVNNALNAGASLGNLRIIVIHANNTRWHRFGDNKPSCKNCTHAFKGRIQENYSGWEEEQ